MGLTLSDRGLELRCDGEHGGRSIEDLARSSRQPEPAPRGIVRRISPEGAYFRAGPSLGATDGLSLARGVGWKETYTPKGEKRWLGPCCSRKKPKTAPAPRRESQERGSERR